MFFNTEDTKEAQGTQGKMTNYKCFVPPVSSSL